jgi:hypothetical protein
VKDCLTFSRYGNVMLHDKFYEGLFNSVEILKCLWECYMINYERLFDFFKIWKCLWKCYMIFYEWLFASFKIYGNVYENVTW